MPQRQRLQPFRASFQDYASYAQPAKYAALENIPPGKRRFMLD